MLVGVGCWLELGVTVSWSWVLVGVGCWLELGVGWSWVLVGVGCWLELGVGWSWVLVGVGCWLELGVGWSWVLVGVGCWLDLGVVQLNKVFNFSRYKTVRNKLNWRRARRVPVLTRARYIFLPQTFGW